MENKYEYILGLGWVGISWSDIPKMMRDNLWQLLIKNTQKFYFDNIDEMKKFILKHQSRWAIEIVAMHNKSYACFVANLFELQGNTVAQPPIPKQLKNSFTDLKPLIFTNLDQLKMFQKLTEKTITDAQQVKIVLIREEIPDFYKNINVVYSWQFRVILRYALLNKKWEYSMFDTNTTKFHLEIEEADEVYAYKTNKLQETLSNLLYNIEIQVPNPFWNYYYNPLSGRILTRFEKEWSQILIKGWTITSVG
jgi:hypothetical protein